MTVPRCDLRNITQSLLLAPEWDINDPLGSCGEWLSSAETRLYVFVRGRLKGLFLVPPP